MSARPVEIPLNVPTEPLTTSLSRKFLEIENALLRLEVDQMRDWECMAEDALTAWNIAYEAMTLSQDQ